MKSKVETITKDIFAIQKWPFRVGWFHMFSQTSANCCIACPPYIQCPKTFKHHGQTGFKMMTIPLKCNFDYVYDSRKNIILSFKNSTAFVKAYSVIKIVSIIIFLQGRNK